MFSAGGGVVMCPVPRARLVERVHVPSVGASCQPPTLAELCSNLEPAHCQRHVLSAFSESSRCPPADLDAKLG